ncbi:MAG: glutathione S-transferase N-terminal domain-containing protein [Methylophilaceae bacterium]|nr:glutathione S-transferase N-terminal domain-containing protein [Methylophilaceae bacterium]
MKLYYSQNSPYARKVRVVAAEKQVTLELEKVDLSDPSNPVPQYNPLGKIPTLVLDDGEVLYDSTVIVEYLDHRTPLSQLIPQIVNEKINVRRWEALADGVCDAAVLVMLEQRKEPNMQDEARIKKLWEKVTRGLQKLNGDLGSNTWCVNNNFSLADISVGCVVGWLNVRFVAPAQPCIHAGSDYPNLARLHQQLLARPSFQNTAPV